MAGKKAAPRSAREQDFVDRAYLLFLMWQCRAFKNVLRRALEQAHVRPQFPFHVGKGEDREQIFSDFQSALTFAANVSKMLWPSPAARDLPRAKNRAGRLRKLLSVVDDPVLRNQLVRNDLEHLDERVDLWEKNSKNKNLLLHLIGSDSAIVGLDATDRFTRYDPATKTFSMLNHGIDVGALETSVARVYAAAESAIAAIDAR